MAQFIDPRLWDDKAFLELKDGSRLLYLHLLFGPDRHIPGLFRDTVRNLAENLERPFPETEQCMKELEGKDLAIVDRRNRVVCCPKAPSYIGTINNNQLKRWWQFWRELPMCDVKFEHVPRLLNAVNLTNLRVAQVWSNTFARVIAGEITRESSYSAMAPHTNVVQLFGHKADNRKPARGQQAKPILLPERLTGQLLDPNRDRIPD